MHANTQHRPDKNRAHFKQKMTSAGLKTEHAHKQKNKASASLIIRARFKQENR